MTHAKGVLQATCEDMLLLTVSSLRHKAHEQMQGAMGQLLKENLERTWHITRAPKCSIAVRVVDDNLAVDTIIPQQWSIL